MEQKAFLPKEYTSHTGNQNFRCTQPMIKAYKVININLQDKVAFKNYQEIIDIRIFCSKGGTCTCIIWVVDKNTRSIGIGRAGGYGYNKESAAIQYAFNNMGITFAKRFAGVGSPMLERAIEEVAYALGYKDILLVSFNP